MKRLAIVGACALSIVCAETALAAEPPSEGLQASRSMSGDFFGTLKAGQVKQAYVAAFPNLQESKPAELQNLAGQTENILAIFGRVIDWEEIKVDPISPHLLNVTYLLRTEKGPLFFKFEYYRAASKWISVNVYFTDTYGNLNSSNF